MRKRYNTPHRSRVVKTRMTEEEYTEFAERLSAYNMSQAEFIRQAITGAAMIVADNLHSAIFSLAAYTVILCFSLFKTGALAKSIFNAH